MSRSRLFSLSLFLLLALAGALGALSGRAQEPVTLLVWDKFTDDAETVDQIVANFMAENPHITVIREVFETDQMRDIVNTAIASGTGPDVIYYDAGPGYAGLLADAGLLLPLTDYAVEYGWTERITPTSAVEGSTLDGVFYGMPLAFDLIGIFYNQTLIDEAGLTAPRTFDELIAFCGAAREQGYIPVAFGNNPGWQAFHQFSMTANQMIGPEAMRTLLFEHEGSWNTPEIVTAIAAYFVDMRDAGCFPDDVNAIGSDDANALFYSGQALLRPWPSGEFVQQMPDYEVGFMPFPEIEGGHGPVWVTGVSSAWFITSGAEDPDAAAAFIDYLFSPAAIELWLADGEGTMPIELDLEAYDLAPMQEKTFAILQSEDAQFGYNIDVLAPAPFNDMMRSGFQLVLAGSKTPEQQAADLQAAWEDGLAAD